jgi:hypothetical protein
MLRCSFAAVALLWQASAWQPDGVRGHIDYRKWQVCISKCLGRFACTIEIASRSRALQCENNYAGAIPCPWSVDGVVEAPCTARY